MDGIRLPNHASTPSLDSHALLMHHTVRTDNNAEATTTKTRVEVFE
jgi:hypothetical protein